MTRVVGLVIQRVMMLAMMSIAFISMPLRAQTGRAQTGRAQLGIIVRPETVTVGQHFTVTVRVRSTRGSQIVFPTAPDSSAAVDTAATTIRRDTSGVDFTESTAIYTLVPWDTGAHRLQLGDVVIRDAAGEESRVSLADASVIVRSVLPADTSLRIPKPARPPIVVAPFNWMPWIIVAAALLLLVLLYALWRWWRRRRLAPVAPMTWAEREFRRVEALKLLDSPMPSEHAIAMAEVMREYLTRQFVSARRSATTHELTSALKRERTVPLDRVMLLLQRIDLLKFARGAMGRDEASGVGAEARAIVRAIDGAVRAASERARQSASAGVQSGNTRSGKAA